MLDFSDVYVGTLEPILTVGQSIPPGFSFQTSDFVLETLCSINTNLVFNSHLWVLFFGVLFVVAILFFCWKVISYFI